MKIFLYYIGKARDPHANALAEEYIKRSARFAKCEMREIDPRRLDPFRKHAAAQKILLDPAGGAIDSRGFARLIGERDLLFIVGGADGLSAEWKSRADLLLSLSPLTMPHELARVVLAEQIYRALTSLRGHPYPR
ncbi:MAG TPA: 23S rRNA (pseudouridine(1915)-N(3))-methyltransferase RlmH [Bryobacteraceae bacterium]|nr:23S rRNA (pseudouridine(1915)-N(3))-methyltransferase RlmH [Bryobacteraceae bacterium]